jgi:hypothetical protein
MYFHRFLVLEEKMDVKKEIRKALVNVMRK